MFDRFSDHARKLMGVARQEAQRFNHDYIGTEHILLGLLGCEQCFAVQVLQRLDHDRAMIARETVKRVKLGPTMVTMGQLPFTPRAKRTLELALEEASLLEDNHLGSEHILLGLLGEGSGKAAQALRAAGVEISDVRERVTALERTDPDRYEPGGGYSVGVSVHEMMRALQMENEALRARVDDVEARVRSLEERGQ